MSVRAMKAGAVEFLTKPVREQDLLDAIQQALERDRAMRHQRTGTEHLRERFDLLTAKEREVMGKVVCPGCSNKQVAGELGGARATRRQNSPPPVMEKMRAGSLAELVRMADRLGLPTPKP